MVKKIAVISGIALGLVLLFNLSRQIYDSLEVSHRLDTEAGRITDLQKKNSELKKKLAEVGSLPFVEQQARDKLGMAREGETVMIIPQTEIEKVLGAREEVKKAVAPYWEGWLRLFVR